MKSSTSRALALPAIVSALFLVAGCATTADVESAKKLAQDAKTSADQANRTAQDAAASAREAKEAAAAARSAAAAAQRAAEEARAASQATGQKIDRAFKKAVQK